MPKNQYMSRSPTVINDKYDTSITVKQNQEDTCFVCCKKIIPIFVLAFSMSLFCTSKKITKICATNHPALLLLNYQF